MEAPFSTLRFPLLRFELCWVGAVFGSVLVGEGWKKESEKLMWGFGIAHWVCSGWVLSLFLNTIYYGPLFIVFIVILMFFPEFEFHLYVVLHDISY